MVLNREELDKLKIIMYANFISEQVEGYHKGYDFEDYLIMIIDLIEYELKDYVSKEAHNNWVLAGGISKPRGELK
tara:strand:+ start:3211 stop:3435 length:225 start_codon:yes stop_codon:yes gene_type:complete